MPVLNVTIADELVLFRSDLLNQIYFFLLVCTNFQISKVSSLFLTPPLSTFLRWPCRAEIPEAPGTVVLLSGLQMSG